MSLWLNETSPNYNAASAGAPAYLSSADRVRWERLRQLRLLYQGKHRQYFLDEDRTQNEFPVEEIAGRRTRRYVTLNLLRLISHTTADLLFGKKPKIESPTLAMKAALDGLVRRSLLHARLHEAAVQASWSGGAFLESTLWRGEAYVELIPPQELFPQGMMMPDGQYGRYVRYAVAGAESQAMLLETIYEPGVIRRRLRRLDGRRTAGEELPLDQWPAFAGGAPASEERTGIDACTITYLANKAGDCAGVSDYDGLLELQDSVNAKFAQVARVLAKHADPKLAMPESSAGPDGTVPAQHDLFFVRSKDDVPQYIVWPAELEHAIRDRIEAILALCATAEMSPVLLGIRQGATPDAARKLRLEATKDLAKTGRKSLLLDPAIARLVDTTLRLDQSTALHRSYPVDPVGVQMRDGLPVDDIDVSTYVANCRAAGVMSLEAGVETLIEDPDAAAVEIERVRAEKRAAAEAATPSVWLDRPAADRGRGPSDEGREEEDSGVRIQESGEAA